eukprot:308023-Prymnesium_polylepis.1
MSALKRGEPSSSAGMTLVESPAGQPTLDSKNLANMSMTSTCVWCGVSGGKPSSTLTSIHASVI